MSSSESSFPPPPPHDAARARLLAESAPVGIWYADAEGGGGWINPMLAEISGLTPECAAGGGWAEALHPEDRERVLAAWQDFVDGQAPFRARYRFVRPDGEVRWVIGQAARDVDDAGRLRGFLGTLTDVTEQAHMEDRLRQTQKMEAIGRLAAGIAHDFNNLLTVILGCTEAMSSELAENDPRRLELEQIRVAGDQATALTRQLLAFGRKQTLQPQPVDLAALLDRLTPLLRRLIGEHVELTLDLPGDMPMTFADPLQLEQIIFNLAANARDAMPRGGRLRIAGGIADAPSPVAGESDAAARSFVRLSFEDTGEGMDESVRRQIFEPFFTTKGAGLGTGLGLATVHGIVHQSGGQITVESAPGAGTSVHVYLPQPDAARPALRHAAAREPATARSSSAAGSDRRRSILLVEDDPGVRKLLARVLSTLPCDLRVAADSESALAEAARMEGGPALLVSDVVLPGPSGTELAERLLSQTPDLRVIFVSGYDRGMLERFGFPRPGMRLLRKPLAVGELLACVRDELDIET